MLSQGHTGLIGALAPTVAQSGSVLVTFCRSVVAICCTGTRKMGYRGGIPKMIPKTILGPE